VQFEFVGVGAAGSAMAHDFVFEAGAHPAGFEVLEAEFYCCNSAPDRFGSGCYEGDEFFLQFEVYGPRFEDGAAFVPDLLACMGIRVNILGRFPQHPLNDHTYSCRES
jgi:hypothetical protein